MIRISWDVFSALSGEFVLVEAYFAADQGGVGVTVSTVMTTSDEDTVQQGSSGDDKIPLVPMMGSGVPSGDSVVKFGGEESVSYAKVMVRAKF